jgi:hypothetical protein
MLVYLCTDHDGFWPVGVSSVIVARDEDHARLLLNNELTKRGLKVTPYTLQPLDTKTAHALILRDGDY